MTKNFSTSITAYFDKLKKTIDSVSVEDVNTLLNLLFTAYTEERTIFIMGNGGSAATVSHMVCDFNKGCSCGQGKRFKCVSLNDNVPMMMAYANDMSYDDVFVEPLKN
ncbi:MAG: SIS domain-containing protein, partial [Bacteroidales bacterium]|nr:SIS domain-containing protein [Bacteroidales bacterium]